MKPLACQRGGLHCSRRLPPVAALQPARVLRARPIRAASSDASPSSSPSTVQQLNGRGRVERFLDALPNGQSIMDLTEGQKQELGAYVSQMVAENPTPAPGTAAVQGGLGTGTWKVFWAPHIAAMSGSLLTRFEPILYKFSADGTLSSHVRWSTPVLGTGWFSASGTMSRKHDDVVEIGFDKFWVDVGESSLRQNLDSEDSVSQVLGMDVKWDAIIGSTGRAFFFPALSVFPVQYLDSEFAVFEFPPLRSKIGIRKVPNT